MENIKAKIFKNPLLLQVVLIILSSAIFCGWSLNKNNFFQFDDYIWHWKIQSIPLHILFNPIPQAPFNDRPVGAFFLWCLFSLFGMNNVMHHIVLFTLHVANSLLFFFVIRLVMKDYLQWNQCKRWVNDLPWVAGIIFAGWSTSTVRAVYWDSAIFDLLGACLILCATFFYVKSQQLENRFLYGSLCVFSYILALRTKEMTVPLPCMLLAITVWYQSWNKFAQVKKEKINIPVILSLFFVLTVYLARHVYLRKYFTDLVNTSNPYFCSNSILILLRNIIRYLAIYFNPYQDDYISSNGNCLNLFYGFWIFLCISFLVYCIKNYLLRKSALILIPILFVTQIAPVLPMQNMQTRLYLYIPSMLLSLFTATVLCFFISQIPSISGPLKSILLYSFTVIILGFISMDGMNKIYRNFYLAVGRENKKIYKALNKIPPPQNNTKIILFNAPEWLISYCLFSDGSGGGDVLKSYYADPSLKSQVTNKRISEIEASQKVYFMNYNNL